MLVEVEYTSRPTTSIGNRKNVRWRYVEREPEIFDIPADNLLDLFHFCQTEWGRAVRKLEIPTARGDKTIGWVFEQRDPEDPTRMLQAWVTMLYSESNTVTDVIGRFTRLTARPTAGPPKRHQQSIVVRARREGLLALSLHASP